MKMNEEQQKLVLDNQKLVYHVIKQLHLYHKLEDYLDVGIIGLCKAAKTFKPENNSKFSTYACICIRNNILMEIRNEKRQCDAYAISFSSIISSSKDKDLTLEDTLSDYELENDILNREELISLITSIEKLNEKDKMIIDLYFYQNKTQKQIAQILNMSQANASRRIQRALNNLRKGGLLNV